MREFVYWVSVQVVQDGVGHADCSLAVAECCTTIVCCCVGHFIYKLTINLILRLASWCVLRLA